MGGGKLYKRVQLLTINSNRLHDLDEGVKSRRFIILEDGGEKKSEGGEKSKSDGSQRARTGRCGYPQLIAIYERLQIRCAAAGGGVGGSGEERKRRRGSPRHRRNPLKL